MTIDRALFHRALRCLPISAVLAAILACQSQDPARAEAAAAARRQAEEARIDALVEARLQTLFPEVQGEITREAITRAVAAAAAGDLSRSDSDVRAATLAAIDAGDYERARAFLGELLAADHIASALELTQQGRIREALAVLDRAAETAPYSAAIRVQRAQAALVVGEEDAERALVEAALADFLFAAGAQPSAVAWLGACRAANALGRGDEALQHARRAVELTRRGDAPALELAAERALAETSSNAYLAARATGRTDAWASAIEPAQVFRESERALEGLVGRTPEDPWVWQRLASIYETEGRLADARARALRGLRLKPDDARLHERLARVALALGGPDALLADYSELGRADPDAALVHWHPALVRFERAVSGLLARQDARAGFESASDGFARSRTLDAGLRENALGYEALCRTGLGWCLYHAGDLEGARSAFLATEDVVRGGLALEIPGRLPSAVLGLHRVGESYSTAQGVNPNDLVAIANVESAARIYDFLHQYEPENATWASNAGLFNRDVAIALERKARAIGAQGRVEEAKALLERARELMESSYRAHAEAARLAPEDLRIANDTGLILAQYLQRDAATAERYLLRAVEIGEREVPRLRTAIDEPGLTPAEGERRTRALEAVENALGDAYQNLGVLHLTLQGDPETARGWFEKSSRTGPDPREEITAPGGWLARCDAALAGESDPLAPDPGRWAAPIGP